MNIHLERDTEAPQPPGLPSDLPRSLNDRKLVREYGGETEMYDGWQGAHLASSSVEYEYS